jgi:ferredoxin
MVIRNIVKIEEKKCNGCGLCIPACAEGAIQIINGKATLVKDIYCDGLGACLGKCPQDAITIIQRDANEFGKKGINAFHVACSIEIVAAQRPLPQECGFANSR